MTDTSSPEGGRPVSEMQERIARAIYEGRNGARCKPWAHQPKAHREPYLLDALAAMKAMREPTEAMAKASRIEQPCPCGRRHTVWAANRWPHMLSAEISIAEGGKDGK